MIWVSLILVKFVIQIQSNLGIALPILTSEEPQFENPKKMSILILEVYNHDFDNLTIQ